MIYEKAAGYDGGIDLRTVVGRGYDPHHVDLGLGFGSACPG
jgi:hypothetical protein